MLIEMVAATPGGIARALDPGLSNAREAAKEVPPESVRHNGNQHYLLKYNMNLNRMAFLFL